MSEAILAGPLALIAEQIAPGASLANAWPLRGGISARMTALELRLPSGETRRVILRQPGSWAVAENPEAAAHEYRFDVLSMLGRSAMEQLTRAYVSAQPHVDLADLPYWDLYAALRPVNYMAE